MSFTSWLRILRSALVPGRTERPCQPRLARRVVTRRPELETLEDRLVLSFSPVSSYATGMGPQDAAVGDFNGDNRLDLAVVNYSSAGVSVLLGDGAAGGFGTALNTTTGSSAQSLAVGDFNGDGKLDLVTVNIDDLSILLGNGNGTFAAPTSLGVGSSPSSVAVGDFNADGKLDLGVTSNLYYPGSGGYYGWYPGWYVGRARVLLGNGAGGFTSMNANWLNYGSHNGAAVADFSGDGKLDFATANSENGTVTVLLGNGNGELWSPVSYHVGASPRSVAAGDVNGDGKIDLVTANQAGQNVGVLLGNGVGGFGSASVWSAGAYPHAVALADFNSDLKTDLITANSDGTVSVLLGAGAGAFKPSINVTAGTGAVGVAVGDFNRDGRPDAASADGHQSVAVLRNDGLWPALDAPSITIHDVTVTEGNSGTVSANFNVTLSAPYNQAITVSYVTSDGYAALAGVDYQAASDLLTFAIGETSKTISVLVNGDREAEANEHFFVNLSGGANVFIVRDQAMGFILDDEPRITIDTPVPVAEGNTGSKAVDFAVRLSTPSNEPVSVNYSTAEGDTEWWYSGSYYYYGAATSGVDFQGQNGTLTFAPGETEKKITVQVHGDREAELNEVFSVNLNDAVGGLIISGHSVGVILDDEPYVSIGGVYKQEGNSGTTAFSFEVTLSNATDTNVTVSYTTVDGSATAGGGDYQAVTSTLTFTPGQTSQFITVQVTGDRRGENDEEFYVQLTGTTGAQLSNAWGYGTILDDEPRLSISDVYKAEGNSGTTVFRFTVSLSAAYDQPVTINFKTVNGTAQAGSDYQAKNGTLTFAPGETVKYIDIVVYGDTSREADEHFNIQLTGPSSNVWVYDEWALAYIYNDDTKPGKGRNK